MRSHGTVRNSLLSTIRHALGADDIAAKDESLTDMGLQRCPSGTERETLTCTGCKNVKYCSPACQQPDLQFHKVLCRSFEDFETRPSQDMCRAICFPPDQPKPEFRCLLLKRLMDHDGRCEAAQTVE
jgi:hypothetical protein